MDKAAMKIVEIVVMLQTVSMLMAFVSMGVFLDTAITSAKHVCAFEKCLNDISYISENVRLKVGRKKSYVT